MSTVKSRRKIASSEASVAKSSSGKVSSGSSSNSTQPSSLLTTAVTQPASPNDTSQRCHSIVLVLLSVSKGYCVQFKTVNGIVKQWYTYGEKEPLSSFQHKMCPFALYKELVSSGLPYFRVSRVSLKMIDARHVSATDLSLNASCVRNIRPKHILLSTHSFAIYGLPRLKVSHYTLPPSEDSNSFKSLPDDSMSLERFSDHICDITVEERKLLVSLAARRPEEGLNLKLSPTDVENNFNSRARDPYSFFSETWFQQLSRECQMSHRHFEMKRSSSQPTKMFSADGCPLLSQMDSSALSLDGKLPMENSSYCATTTDSGAKASPPLSAASLVFKNPPREGRTVVVLANAGKPLMKSSNDSASTTTVVTGGGTMPTRVILSTAGVRPRPSLVMPPSKWDSVELRNPLMEASARNLPSNSSSPNNNHSTPSSFVVMPSNLLESHHHSHHHHNHQESALLPSSISSPVRPLYYQSPSLPQRHPTPMTLSSYLCHAKQTLAVPETSKKEGLSNSYAVLAQPVESSANQHFGNFHSTK